MAEPIKPRRTYGDAVARFFRNFRHEKGVMAGRPFEFDPFQQKDVDLIYEVDEQGRRVWRSVLVGWARGLGKSPIAAGSGILELVSRRDKPDVIVAAAARHQAGIIQDFGSGFVRGSALNDYCRVLRNAITYAPSGGSMRTVSADGHLQHGLSISDLKRDEIHSWLTEKQVELYWALETALHKRHDSTSLDITTAGWNKRTLLGERYDAILKTHQVDADEDGFRVVARDWDAGSLMIWRGAPEDADVSDPAVWRKAYPASWISENDIRRLALTTPENVFRRLILNQWCMTPDTLVTLASGGLRAADELQAGDRIVSFDERTGELVEATVSVVRSNGVKPVYRVSTKRGRSIRVTADHRFWCRLGRAESPRYGWVRAEDLEVGSRVAVALGLPDHGEASEIEPDVAYFLGLMTGDGSVKTEAALSNMDEGVIDWCRSFAASRGVALRERGDHPAQWRFSCGKAGGRNEVLEILREHGLFGHGSHDKRVPPAVMEGANEDRRRFLAGYLDADGCVSGGSVVWVSVNRALLEDCQTMLAALGAQSTVRAGRRGEHATWRLEVHCRHSLGILRSLPSVSAKRPRLEALDDGPQTDRERFDVVTGLVLEGATETVGVTAEGTHTHVTAGLITHNTEAESTWLPLGAWDRCSRGADAGVEESAEVVLAFVGRYRGDAAALVGWTFDGRGFTVDVWEGDDDYLVPREAVDEALEREMSRRPVKALVVDDYGWIEQVQDWRTRWPGVVETPIAKNRRQHMVRACSRFYTDVVNGVLSHDGDRRSGRHLAQAMARQSADGSGVYITTDPDTELPVVAALALVMGYERACGPLPPTPWAIVRSR